MKVFLCALLTCAAAAAQTYPLERVPLFNLMSNVAQNIKVTAEDVAARAAGPTPDLKTILEEIKLQSDSASLIETHFWRVQHLRTVPQIDNERVMKLKEIRDVMDNRAVMQRVALEEDPAKPNWKRLRSVAKSQAKFAAKFVKHAALVDQ